MSERIYKKPGEGDNDFDAGFKIPDTKSLLKKMGDSSLDLLRKEHQMQSESEDEKEKQGKGDKTKKRQRRGGSICCCGAPHCRIGPFVETEEKGE